MANTISPNMGLIIPGVGTEAGPTYATDVNTSLNTVDAHNHSSGSGVPVTPSGLNINSDLPMNGFNLTLTNTARFVSLGSTLTNAAPNIGCLYVSGNELYYNDYSGGHIVALTANGSPAGGAGSINGLPSGTASVTYTSSTYVFQSAATVPATIDIGSVIIRNTTASSNGITLQAPTALGSNYTLTLPATPAQTNVMTLSAAGNMGSITYDAVGQAMTSVGADAIATTMDATGANTIANTRTRAVGSTVGVGGVAVSSSCGTFSTSSTTFVSVTNLSVTITTSGRPVRVYLQSDGLNTFPNSYFSIAVSGGGTAGDQASCALLRGATILSEQGVGAAPNSGVVPSSSISTTDFVAAGTYTYVAQLKVVIDASNTAAIRNSVLVAYEL